MRILGIGTDRGIFVEGSPAQERQAQYATRLEQLVHIVYALRTHGVPDEVSFGATGTAYATQSRSRVGYLRDAYHLGARVLSQGSDWVVSSQDPFETGLVALQLARRFRVPLHVQVHVDFLSPAFAAQSFMQRARVQLGMMVLRRADRIRVVSQRVKASIVAREPRLESRIDVIPIFVDGAAIAAAPIDEAHDLRTLAPDAHPRVLVASRLTKEKNISLAIAAIAQLQKTSPSVALFIVGEGPLRAALEREATHLQGAVHFLPWTTSLASYYKTADVYLITSLYEGYGRTIVEAAAAGVAMVSTDVGVADIMGATIADATPTAIARAIEKTVAATTRRIAPNLPSLPELLDAHCASWEAAHHARARR